MGLPVKIILLESISFIPKILLNPKVRYLALFKNNRLTFQITVFASCRTIVLFIIAAASNTGNVA